jgi:Type II secretion system (T2SS), protein M subtype b
VITQRERRTLLIGAFVIAVVAIARAIPSAINWRTSEMRAAEEIVTRLRSASVLIGAEREIRDSLRRRLERLAENDSAFMHVSSSSLAEASFATWIAEFAEATDVGLEVVHVKADTGSRTSFGHVVARVTATADLESLASFLAAVESGPLLVTVSEMTIVQPEPGIPSARTERLRAEIAVQTLMQNRVLVSESGGDRR